MASADEIGTLIEHAYAAALDDILWVSLTQALTERLDAAGAAFWVVDAERRSLNRSALLFPGHDADALTRDYLGEGHDRHDPQMKLVSESVRSMIYCDADHVDMSCAETRNYMRWQEWRVGTRHHIAASIKLADTLRAGLSFHRTREQGEAPESNHALIKRLFPDLKRAMRLGFKHSQALSEAYWDGTTSGTAHPLLLLDERGRILHANAAAETLLADGDGLTALGRRLRPLYPIDDKGLEAAIASALSTEMPQASCAAVSRRSGRPAYLVACYPLVRQRRYLSPYEASALVMIVDPEQRVVPPQELYQRAYGLTAQEARVTALLIAGHDVRHAAAKLGMAENTMRIHIRNIFRKTAVNRQSELIRLLAQLRPQQTSR